MDEVTSLQKMKCHGMVKLFGHLAKFVGHLFPSDIFWKVNFSEDHPFGTRENFEWHFLKLILKRFNYFRNFHWVSPFSNFPIQN
jgi:hypothetical protein